MVGEDANLWLLEEEMLNARRVIFYVLARPYVVGFLSPFSGLSNLSKPNAKLYLENNLSWEFISSSLFNFPVTLNYQIYTVGGPVFLSLKDA